MRRPLRRTSPGNRTALGGVAPAQSVHIQKATPGTAGGGWVAAWGYPKLLREPGPTTLPAMPENATARTQAKKERPWWLTQRRFVVPATLLPKIRNAPEAVQIILCYIVSKVVIETKKHPSQFKGISSRYFKDFIGSEYVDYLKILDADWRIIEIHGSYWNGEDGFCKGYRLRPKAMAAPMRKVCFRKKQVHPLKDQSELADDVVRFVHGNLKRLTVRADLLPQSNVIDDVDAEAWAERIYFQQFNVHYSAKAKRLYHAAITMPKVARRNFILKENPALALYEYDVKSCAPVILLGVTHDPAEKAKLKSLLDGDIYTAIASESGVTKDRDTIKQDFMKFVNGSVQNYIHTFFHTHLPSLAEMVMKSRGVDKGVAWFGQSVEAEIMVQKVPRQLIQAGQPNSVNQSTLSLTCGGNPEGILYIPMHDGWLGVEQDERQIAATVRQEFFRCLGYWVTITKTKLATGEETRLVAGALQGGED